MMDATPKVRVLRLERRLIAQEPRCNHYARGVEQQRPSGQTDVSTSKTHSTPGIPEAPREDQHRQQEARDELKSEPPRPATEFAPRLVQPARERT